MIRRRSSRSRRGVRPDPVERALSVLRATVCVAELFGGPGLLVIPRSLGGGFQPVVSQRLVF